MELANSLIELINNIWGLASKPLGYTCNLSKNVKLLQQQTRDLQTKSDDMKTRVEEEERGGARRPTKEVTDWLNDVRDLVERERQVHQEADLRDQMKCLSRWLPRNYRSSYKLGKKVYEMLNEARDLQKKKEELRDLTLPLSPPVVLNMPMAKDVGLDTSLKMVWKWLADERQGVIGLWGQGGVGKTTLMKRINQELSRTNLGFEVVIWVEASKNVNVDKIQDTIRKRLGIKEEPWNGWDGNEKVHYLLKKLAEKKFVLLIDDVWKRLDLPKIGVPLHVPESRFKIVFTTREEDVCKQMGAEKTSFKLQCLTTEQALQLFVNNVGESTVNSHPKITELAKGVTEECKGLPLALVTVGRAMANTTKPGEWEEALTTLKENPHEFSGMEEDVYRILKFSYDRLNDSTIQCCFLYCCLFPEDYHIRPHDLIGLWIGEDLLGHTDDVYSLRSKGERVLRRLNSACLLESGRDDGEAQYVKMHDVIRDMATWINRYHEQRENKWLVMEKEDLSEKMISKWKEADKVSLWGIRNIGRKPFKCSQLKTLIVRETNVRFMPKRFFYSMMDCLVVLDLSDNKDIQSFPEDICNLISLQYLNLSATDIRELPREIKNLTCLRWLLLDYLEKINLISVGAIASLPLLNVLSMWGTFLEKEEEMVEELERMRHLTDLSVSVGKSSSVQKLFLSLTLQRSLRRAWIADSQNDLTNIVISHSSTGNGSFLHLETLLLNECLQLVKMQIDKKIERAHNCPCFPSLVDVRVNCCKLSDLSWFMHAPKLRQLMVVGCDSMEKIIGDGFAPKELEALRPFSDLKFVKLHGLPKLMSDQVLSFPQGVELNIVNCPGLVSESRRWTRTARGEEAPRSKGTMSSGPGLSGTLPPR